MHLVLPALNLYTLNAGILIMMHQVRLIINDVLTEHGGLLHVLPLAVLLRFLWDTSFMLKSFGGGGGVVGTPS